MKGVFFHQQLEFRLEVEGDELRQGDVVPCTLSVKNHGSAPQPPGRLTLALANGNMKKVKQKAEDAFEVIATAECPELGEIAPGKQESFSHTFQLAKDSVITDGTLSPYLLFGSADVAGATGQLLLTVHPHKHIQEIVGLLETHYQFVPKGLKSSKGWVSYKMKPPSAKRFSLVNELSLGFRFEQDNLGMRYNFNVKKFEATSTALGVRKAKTDVAQNLEPSDYLFAGQYVNHEKVLALMSEALGAVASEI